MCENNYAGYMQNKLFISVSVNSVDIYITSIHFHFDE